jgi:hypothetical protein
LEHNKNEGAADIPSRDVFSSITPAIPWLQRSADCCFLAEVSAGRNNDISTSTPLFAGVT